MNYFMNSTSRPSFPLVYDNQNVINGSYIAIGKYIIENLDAPLKYVDAKNCNIKFEKLLLYDVLESVGGGWLISQKLADIIESNFPNEVQLLKSIFTYKGKICDTYSAINIFQKIDCYDMEKSIYTRHPVDRTYKFTKSELKVEPLKEYGITYNIVRNSYDNRIVVSNEFRMLIKKNKINSLSFKKE